MARKYKEVEAATFVILGKTEIENEIVQSVEGTLQEKQQMNMRGGLVGRYAFNTEDGLSFTVLGAKLLDELMVNVSVGDYVRITLLPETSRTSSGNEMKTFRVEIAE